MAKSNGRELPAGEVSLVAVSPAMKELWRQIEKIAATDIPVLIEGPAGVGKGLVARAIHRASPRAARPLVIVDGASLGEEVFEAELFGWAPAAFPGVEAHREGLAGVADGGTLFIDSVGELPTGSQAKLLRFLDLGLLSPQGPPESARSRSVDLRILSAHRGDLRAEVRAGRFRADLYFRLRGVLLRVPGLRDRREDLPALVEGFVARYRGRYGKAVAGVSAEAMERLLSHPWEGNMRELESEIERAILRTAAGQLVQAESLAIDRRLPAAPDGARLRQYRRQQEKEMVVEALEGARWNVSAAARQLGLSRVGLSKKIKTLGLKRPGPHPGGRPLL
ncbi:MAG TPA: sigma 54-interacting transcriptional regulator [Thermoanaerobaculia bacterium]|nr:sigma 54-interacting transcriptional regulator [Thermoanaerobaculia bacterium]